MKTRIFTLSILLLSALTVLAGNKIDKLFDQVKDLPNAEYTHEKISKTSKPLSTKALTRLCERRLRREIINPTSCSSIPRTMAKW